MIATAGSMRSVGTGRPTITPSRAASSCVGQSAAIFKARLPPPPRPKKNLSEFQNDDVEVGQLLGSGSFAAVYSVRVCSPEKLFGLDFSYTSMMNDLSLSAPTESSSADEEDDEYILAGYSKFSLKSGLQAKKVDNLFVDSNDRHKHAIKRMREDLSEKRQAEAVEVLRNEVAVLSLLPSFHPNIINLHGISENFWNSPSTGFFVVERLVESLEHTLRRWKEESTSSSSSSKRWGLFFKRKVLRKKQHLTRQSQAERINSVGVGIAKALQFLHKHQILFRDLKTENVGFDLDGNVRIFDFGLARKLRPGNNSRKLTLHVGTLRYMAPEVARYEQYGFPADVYSFALVLWEICSFEEPFTKCQSYGSLKEVVRQREVHPSLGQIHSSLIRSMLQHCWHWSPAVRPSMNAVFTGLLKEVGATIVKEKEQISI